MLLPVLICMPDDEYEGMLIPKDSTVFIPVWAIHHSGEIYEDDDAFSPDRYQDYTKLANDYAGSPDWQNEISVPIAHRFPYRCSSLHINGLLLSANIPRIHHYGYGAG